ncbi:sulfite oxidase isoform X1 [Pieris napi]|uniref:sulfite oxidase isoform X1 n=1 Tax=Pieris napi TaxID=78633 RepID=UPI001FB8C58A|nr:sulfite oxidase isoform X1 [Pieris napi]
MSLKTLLFRGSLKGNKFINFTPIVIRNQYERQRNNTRKLLGATSAFIFSSVAVGLANEKNKSKDEIIEAGAKRPDLPTYRAEEVSKHDSKSSFWVIYKNGVYDVTSFLPSHPGGEQILNAGGFSIEPFWNVYGMHKTAEIYTLLESYRIGNLHDEDVMDHSDHELWVKEPYRDKRLIVKTAKPFNAEIPPKEQVEHFDTPNELFYVRQHMPVPELDEKTHSFKIYVKGVNKQFEFSLSELDRFPRVSIRAALMCAGNRRSEMNKQVKPVKGLNWAGGAISNAVWTGVRLRDVLIHCGVDLEDTEGKHVIFTGADMDATGMNFSTSIPLHQAVDPRADILIATHMNGVPLPPDHGYPLRAIVPGAPAVRSVKWLESITISRDESPSHWHQKDYRGFNPSKTWETADFSTAPPVYSLPVTSALCDPVDGDTVNVKGGCVTLKGYAYSGGGAKILRVDVSMDQGQSWIEAELKSDPAPPRQHYSWTLWRLNVPVKRGDTKMEVWVKATDSNFNTQPEKFDDIWNIRGILGNAYHKVKFNVKHN